MYATLKQLLNINERKWTRMKKSRGVTERELDATLLAKIGMGNYLQKQTISVPTTEDNQKIIPIPMVGYNSQVYKFDINIDGFTYADYNYDIDEDAKTIVLKDNVNGIPINKKVDFIFQWNAYVNKTIESPTVYLDDCTVKVCTINHNMKKYPQIQVLEVLYGAGIGGAGEYPAGAGSKMLYPRIDYMNRDTCELYLNDEYEGYSNPVLNRVAEGKYVVTFDAPCVKSLLILVDKMELFASEEYCYIDQAVTEIINPVKGFVRNQVMYGSTLQNIWDVNLPKSSWDSANNRAARGSIGQKLFKATTYTIINVSNKAINIRKSSSLDFIPVHANSCQLLTLVSNEYIRLLSGLSIDGWTNSNYSELDSACVILEGDYTNKPKPTSYFKFTSVGDTSCKLKVTNGTDVNASDYNESIIDYNIILRSIGAVRDEYDIDSNTIKRNIATSKLGIDFIDSVTCDTLTSKTSTYHITLKKSCDLGDVDLNIDSLCNKTVKTTYEDILAIESVYRHTIKYTASTKTIDCHINIYTGSLTDINTNAVLSYFKNNDYNIQYVLPVPVEEKVSDIPLKFNDDTKYVVIDSVILPEIEFSYPLNIKSSVDNLVDSINNLRDDLQKISAMNKTISDIMDNTISRPTIGFGMNNVIKRTNKMSVSPKFNIKGKTLINILGKDGNCENLSNWNSFQNTRELDAINKVFGNNGIKIILTSTTGNLFKKVANLDISKYYLFSAYLKNGNATSVFITKSNGGGGVELQSKSITETTKFTRVGIVCKPSDLNVDNNFMVNINGAIGQYAYVDGVMVNEISAEEYSSGVDALLNKYSYVDSYTCLTNPYIEIKHNNLIRNGGCEEGTSWWMLSNSTLKVNMNGGFDLVANASISNAGIYQIIDVKPNTNYQILIDFNVNSDFKVNIAHRNKIAYAQLYDSNINGTFNSGDCGGKIEVWIYTNTPLNSCNLNHIMIVEGNVPPTEYKPCKIERCVIEGKFADGDSFTYKDGKAHGIYNNKHKILFGNNYAWEFYQDDIGFKKIGIPLSNFGDFDKLYPQSIIKYDGKMLLIDQGTSKGDTQSFVLSEYNKLYLQVFDTDTGWAEGVNPTTNDIKAFMNGWKTYYYVGNGKTIAWWSVVDNSQPADQAYSIVTATIAVGQKVIPVQDGSRYIVGKSVLCINSGQYEYNTVASVSGNNITLTNPTSFAIGVNNALVQYIDVSYVANNIAPNYEGYQLHYKTQNPEPITDINTHIHGDILTLDEGDNYLLLDSGMVLGEVVNPYYDNSYYNINNHLATLNNDLKNKNQNICNIYKNQMIDNTWSRINDSAYGNYRLANTAVNFDINAVYSVDYKILATQTPQVGEISCSYTQDLTSILNDLQEEINSRQKNDNLLDNIVDLSIYENDTYDTFTRGTRYWHTAASQTYFKFYVPFSVIKKTIPSVILTVQYMRVFNTVGESVLLNYNDFVVGPSVVPSKKGFYVWGVLNAGTKADYALNSGLELTINWKADCTKTI